MIPIHWFLELGAVLFVIGSLGVILRRNALIMLMGIELHAERRQFDAWWRSGARGTTRTRTPSPSSSSPWPPPKRPSDSRSWSASSATGAASMSTS